MTKRQKITIIISFVLSISLITGIFSFVLYSREHYYKELIQKANSEIEYAQQVYNKTTNSLNKTEEELAEAYSELADMTAQYVAEYNTHKYFEDICNILLYNNSIKEDLYTIVKNVNSSNRYGHFSQSVYTVKAGETLIVSGKYSGNEFDGYYDNGLRKIYYYEETVSTGDFKLYFLSGEAGLYTIGINSDTSSNNIRALVIVYE